MGNASSSSRGRALLSAVERGDSQLATQVRWPTMLPRYSTFEER